MSRRFSVPMPPVIVTLPQDLFQITCPNNKVLRILRRRIGAVDSILPTSQMLNLRERYLPSVANGTGGTAANIAKTNQSDVAASFTALLNNTSKASSVTPIVLNQIPVHIYNGYDEKVDEPWEISPGAAYVFELLSTVSNTVTLSGSVLVEELG